MILNPVERYYTNKGRQEGYKEGFKKGFDDGFEEIRLIIAEKMIKKGFQSMRLWISPNYPKKKY